jgi:hypothetical protein
MFSVINLATTESIEEVFKSGKDAAAKAAALTEETGIKHQPRKITENPDWQNRERVRLLDGTYTPLPLHPKMIAALDRRYPTHFLYLSDKPPMIAFTKDANMGASDRQTRMTIKTYLLRYFPRISECTSQRIINAIEQNNPVKFAHTPEEITEVYTNYHPSYSAVANSCMRYRFRELPCHPVSVYGAGDLAIAYFTNNGKTTHRALCWPAKKIYSRMYAPDDKLHVALKSLGYVKSRYYPGHRNGASFAGARLLKIESIHHNTYVMPYIDETGGVNIEDDHFVFTIHDSEYKGCSENGMTEIEEEEEEDFEICDYCEDPVEETVSVIVSSGLRDYECWCSHCCHNHAFQCNGTYGYYDAARISQVEMYNGEIWSQNHFDRHGGTCDYTNENFPLDQLTRVTTSNGFEMWCQNARDKHAILTECEWFAKDFPHPDQTSLELEPTTCS